MRKSGMEASFRYNANGLRTHKLVNGVVTKYTLHGKNVVHMTHGEDELHFFYDAQNRPAAVVYNGVPYAYVKNLQGDVIAILDADGNVVVGYTYDAWGQPIGKSGTLAETLGTLNPFRYRGYVYDEETRIYYLRSRYYNAEKCRFVNADTDMGNYGVLSTNLYLYCLNDSVNRIDESGFASCLATLQKRVVNMFTIALYSVLTQREDVHEAEIVTVSQMFENFAIMEKRKTDVSSSNDTGCAMYIRAAITGKLKRHSHHVYHAGMQSMFDNDLILQGEISDIGGVEGLIPGMILGSAKNKKNKIAHGGVYYGLYDFGDGYVPAVYSFNTRTVRDILSRWVMTAPSGLKR